MQEAQICAAGCPANYFASYVCSKLTQRDEGPVADNKVFVSHGSQDLWVAGQIAKEVRHCGATPFFDETNIPKGCPNFREVIRTEIAVSRELVALYSLGLRVLRTGGRSGYKRACRLTAK